MTIYRARAEARAEASRRNAIVSRETGIRYVVEPAYHCAGYVVVETFR